MSLDFHNLEIVNNMFFFICVGWSFIFVKGFLSVIKQQLKQYNCVEILTIQMC